MSKKSRRPVKKPEKELSGWARLSKGTKALVALIGTTAVAAVVPGVLPWASDRVLDFFHRPIVEVTGDIGSSIHGLDLAASETVAIAPLDAGSDPRFIPAGYALTKLTVEGKRSAAVSILDASVEVEARLPPRRGTLFVIPPQGEGDNTLIDLDLDAPRPGLVTHDGRGPFFIGKHLTIDRGEVSVIAIESRATRHEYAWRLHLRLRYRGSDRELVVPPAGQPAYRMTAFVAPADYRRQFVWNANGEIVPHDCATAKTACAATTVPVVKAP